ncbi:unnamed protein product [Parascedosporium putredinis]|uniref:Glucosamine/galactosamine-6-phosphate isomerase domain-containing protein n=1 Tax=Parascedosporium putredinis TaxID=1442378 RepID=A0A9P1M850_9PEZI|nr:unnamed protein product [Parascedosporium putredinis]CAI7989241.1 unnamed protein product [Parascedosporium putredinis]
MTGQANLCAFPDVDILAPALRTYIAQCEQAGLLRHDVFKIAVSGGSLPNTLARALLAPATGPADELHFDKWEIFFADERAVPLDHADSNYGLLKKEFLDKIPADQGQPIVHPIDVQHLDDVQELADQYEQVLRITLSLPVVTHSVRVAFVATGGGKKDIMKAIFERGDDLPCALVNSATGERCTWFVDNPAVEGVSYPRKGFL